MNEFDKSTLNDNRLEVVNEVIEVWESSRCR